MPDNPSQGQPVGGSSEDQPTQDSLDDLLAGAAELAANLGEEIGTDGATGSATQAIEATISDDPQQASIDSQLDQIESLLDSTATDLGVEQATDGADPLAEQTAPEPDQAAAAATPAGDDPPDTERPKGANSLMTPEELAELEGGANEPTGDEDLSVIDDSDLLAEPSPDDGAGGESPAPPTAADQPDNDGPPVRTSATLIAIVDRVGDVLDRFDRPFTWVGYTARRLIGWAALAILLAAVCVFVVSNMP